MAVWHGYMGVENLALNGDQKALLVAELRGLGVPEDPSPARRCHWRVRNDGEGVIFEAAFDEDALTVERFRRRLGTIFGVSWVTIGASVGSATFAARASPVVVFSRSGVDYLRVALFGGVDATWLESLREVLAYIALHPDLWGW